MSSGSRVDAVACVPSATLASVHVAIANAEAALSPATTSVPVIASEDNAKPTPSESASVIASEER